MKTLQTAVACAGGGALAIYVLHRMTTYISNCRLRRRFDEKCKTWPKDVVILHGMRRGLLTPNASPFVLKLETFLRMHKIPYIFDWEFPKGDKLKMPWITVNGEHYTDSQLIIDFLSAKYGINDSVEGTDKSLAAASTMARIMMDEHFFWGLVLWRTVYTNGEGLEKIFNMSASELKAWKKVCIPKWKHFAWCQGTGRHSQDEVIKLMNQDLLALSNLLGTNDFFGGKEACSNDAAVFAMISQLVWNDVTSPYSKLVEEELGNLREYCFRMKDRYWPDWDEVIKAAL